MAYWLMKSEPETFSIDDLEKIKTEHWDGVRNYQARNFMKAMKKKDFVFFYHSNCTPPGIVGVAEVSKEFYPDHTSFDKNSEYYDPKSTPEKPRWFMVEVTFKEKFKNIISLDQLKEEKKLEDLALVKKGNRLSVMPITEHQWKTILELKS
jgi:predicted RNA-binding protein with PUA-like domain